MKQLKKLFKHKDLIAVQAMKSELGYNTVRWTIYNINSAIEWMKKNENNSIRFIFDNDVEYIDFRLDL